jgi:rod shape-determining protein MreD
MHNTNRGKILTINILVFSLVILFHISNIASLRISTATPLFILPLLTAFSIFNSPVKSVVMGFFAGAALDSVSLSFGFNTVCLMILSLAVCLAANNLFNKNLRAAAVMSLLCAALYYISVWAVFHLFNATVRDSLGYLLQYGFPSAVYSAIFIFPFFYLYRYLEKLKTQ